jgi:hypothetical protein
MVAYDECEAIIRVIIRETYPSATFTPQKSHNLTWDRTLPRWLEASD